jgi:hypothetical protein
MNPAQQMSLSTAYKPFHFLTHQDAFWASYSRDIDSLHREIKEKLKVSEPFRIMFKIDRDEFVLAHNDIKTYFHHNNKPIILDHPDDAFHLQNKKIELWFALFQSIMKTHPYDFAVNTLCLYINPTPAAPAHHVPDIEDFPYIMRVAQTVSVLILILRNEKQKLGNVIFYLKPFQHLKTIVLEYCSDNKTKHQARLTRATPKEGFKITQHSPDFLKGAAFYHNTDKQELFVTVDPS